MLILVLVVFGLGLVAVQNFLGEKSLGEIKLFPEQFTPPPSPSTTASPVPIATVSNDWQVFNSHDHSFRFRYPPGWKLVETASRKNSQGVYGMTVQSWNLNNIETVDTQGELPAGAIKMEFEILTEGRKEVIENLLDCEGPSVVDCQTLNINGVDYKRTISKNEEGQENIMLATVKNDRIYRISGIISPNENQQGVRQVEEIMATFEILQSS